MASMMTLVPSVTNYDRTSAVLTLEHNFPVDNGFKALVNIQLLLNSVKSHETRIGEWVNVVGYVVDIGEHQDTKRTDLNTRGRVSRSFLYPFYDPITT
ncbi:predicted protein [Sclerotinia sclerotiorum 1980 UF-70]|uniref:Uncharacterized protein n=1 Tax=Sclerotinia sclerotiorum (strain ATCC 18683 / 1980 / Ss-1) TaxID=665079 RepID=A7EZ41_SCLS1|nr:predicted protein [Sclerotinia sclerotiorum 1980 UF-70]EDN94733.1 predicted protein [Sclerotinia sclerotiorum 1980 UF-70]